MQRQTAKSAADAIWHLKNVANIAPISWGCASPLEHAVRTVFVNRVRLICMRGGSGPYGTPKTAAAFERHAKEAFLGRWDNYDVDSWRECFSNTDPCAWCGCDVYRDASAHMGS